MGELPLDAQHVVDELRAARRATAAEPRSWAPSESFDGALADSGRPPIYLNSHLAWMHANWRLAEVLAPPAQRGIKGAISRVAHRVIMFALKPYFERLQDYLGVNVRAMEAVSRRVDDVASDQLRMLGAVRHDMIDFAHHIDERLDD